MAKLSVCFCVLLVLISPVFARELWTAYSNGNQVQDLYIQGDTLWVGTTGGLVKWDTQTRFCSKMTSLDGVCGNDIKCVQVAPGGLLWVGTDNGLSIYDGSVWRTFTEADGLGGKAVWDIDFTADGSVWLATAGNSSSDGVTFFDGSTVRVYTHKDGLSGFGGTRRIAIGPDGHVWFSAPNGLDEFDGSKFTSYSAYRCSWPLDIAPDSEGDVWCIFDGGMFRLDNGVLGEVTKPNNFPIGGYSLAFDALGVLWIGGSSFTSSEGLWSFDGENWRQWTESDGLCNNNIRRIVVAEDGTLWLGTDGGVSRFDGNRFTTYATQDILYLNNVLRLCPRHDGGVAYATPIGVGLFDGATWTLLMTGPGAPVDVQIYDMAEDFLGNIWVATGDGARRFDGQLWRSFWHEPADPHVQCIANDRDASTWFGTRGGLSRFDGTNWQSWTMDDGLVGNDITSIAVSPDGMKWFGVSQKGLMSFDGDKTFVHYPPEVIGTYIVRSIAFDSHGTLWIPVDGGIRSFDGEKWTMFGEETGFPASSASVIAIDRNDTKWVSVFDKHSTAMGVCSFDGTTWKHYTVSDGLLSDTVRDIIIGKDGSIWFATNCGISRLQLMPELGPGLTLHTDKLAYHYWQTLRADIACSNPDGDMNVDIWIGLSLPNGDMAFWPPQTDPGPFYSGTLPAGASIGPIEFASILLSPAWQTGDYAWMAGLFQMGTGNLIGDVASASFTLM